MSKIKKLICVFLSLVAIISLEAQVIPVEIFQQYDGSFIFVRQGEPYFVKGGATSNTERFNELALRGGNSLRTWGIDNQTPSILDKAQQLGLTVMLGYWIGRETDGFDYNNTQAVAQQLENIRQVVMLYKDHPAVLAWAIGNEANINATNPKVWDAVNDISKMIHEVDKNHPTLTVTAGISQNLANTLAQRSPDLDFLGINTYGGIGSTFSTIQNSNWKKPYMFTEWGINGPWESPETDWDAPLEPTSTEKAATLKSRYETYLAGNNPLLLGGYAFLWNMKTEATPTWFGFFVNNETTGIIDVLQYKWTGNHPENSSPEIQDIQFKNHTSAKSYIINSSYENEFEVFANDPDGDDLTYEFIIRPESGTQGLITEPGASLSGIPGIIHQNGKSKARLIFYENWNNKNLRLFIFVHDGKNHVATANIPLQIKLVPNQELKLYPLQDAFVMDGIYSDSAFGIKQPNELWAYLPFNSDSTCYSYVQFDISKAVEPFTSVKLTLFTSSVKMSSIGVSGFGGLNWNENTIKWSNKIEPPLELIDSIGIEPSTSRLCSFEVGSFIKNHFENGESLVSFVLTELNRNSRNPMVFNSSESLDNIPYLVFINKPNSSKMDAHFILFTVYPNPAKQKLTVTLGNHDVPEYYSLEIYNLQGYKVYETALLENPSEVNISVLQKGVYFIVVTHPEKELKTGSFFIKTE